MALVAKVTDIGEDHCDMLLVGGCNHLFIADGTAWLDHAVSARSGHRVQTTAAGHLGQVDGAPAITRIELNCEANVPGVDEKTFLEQAEVSKKGCPVSKALAGVEISLEARLVN